MDDELGEFIDRLKQAAEVTNGEMIDDVKLRLIVSQAYREGRDDGYRSADYSASRFPRGEGG
jgi:hypothetical protein